MPKWLLNIGNIRVDLGDCHKDFKRGDELVDVPEGTLKPMISNGDAVLAEEYIDPNASMAVEEAPIISSPPWHALPVSALEIEDAVKHALMEAGLAHVSEVLDYVSANKSLAGIDGLTAKDSKEVEKAIRKVATKK